jgi:hypothetical protein
MVFDKWAYAIRPYVRSTLIGRLAFTIADQLVLNNHLEIASRLVCYID